MMPSTLSRSLLTSLPHFIYIISLTITVTRTHDNTLRYGDDVVDEEQPKIKACMDPNQVCTSLFKYDEDTVLKESQYCACAQCIDPPWDEEDGMSITWYHQERGDRLVQYRFCKRVVPKSICKEDRDVAVTIRVNTNGWNPTVKKIWCGCPGGKYVLKGWSKMRENGQNYWEYVYTCKKVTCDLDSPCVRRYMTVERDKSKAYKFQCSCPKGMSCPVQTGPSKKYEEVLDESGQPYVNGYCKLLHGVPSPPQEQPTTIYTQNTEHVHMHTEP